MGLERMFSIRSWVLLVSAVFWSGGLPAGNIETVAGGMPKKPLPPLDVGLEPQAVAHGPNQEIYILSGTFVFELFGKELTLIAGSDVEGYKGDGGPALDAQFRSPPGSGR